MRVLVVSNVFPSPSRPDWGVFVHDQIKSLRQLTAVEVVAKNKARFGYFDFWLRTLNALLRERYDLVHAHYGFHSALLPITVSQAPVVTTFHGSDGYCEPYRNSLFRLMQRRTVDKSARLVAVSGALKKHLVSELGAEPAKVDVIPCGVDTSVFRPLCPHQSRIRVGMPPDKPCVLYVGRLELEKGLCLVRRASEKLPECHFFLLGSGPVKWRADNCRFCGPVPHSDIPVWLNAADALILPSYSEGSPVCVIESLACGTPVIASAVGSCPEMITDGVTGRLIPPDDADALASAIRSSLNDFSFDRKRARQVVIERYDIRIIAEKLVRTYEQASATCSATKHEK